MGGSLTRDFSTLCCSVGCFHPHYIASHALPSTSNPLSSPPLSYLTAATHPIPTAPRLTLPSQNAPVLVDLEGETDPLQIAIKELNQKKIPLIVRRYLPDGWYEDWSCEELLT